MPERTLKLWISRAFGLALLLSSLATAALAQIDGPPPAASLAEQMRRLHTTARILHITAHPDDEDGGMLVMEARGKGATVMLLTLNRGEGGQNETGPELFDQLGILRTLELLAADREYGVEQRFTRAADFGFSKTAEESLQKWGGHDPVLSDVVRVIREFQPDVIVSRFQGNSEDGHGNHQVAGILAQEAFRAAADPHRFPEQLSEGLHAWQAKKLYIGNIHPERGEAYTVKLDESVNDLVLGGTYTEIGMRGLHHQLSQGAGEWRPSGGPVIRYYRLVDSTIPNYKPEHEQDFMDGIDTGFGSLPAGSNTEIAAGQKAIEAAAISKDPAALIKFLKTAQDDFDHLEGCGREPGIWRRIQEKKLQLADALNLASGVSINATVELASPPPEPAVAVPGSKVELILNLQNNGKISVKPVGMDASVENRHLPGNQEMVSQPIAAGQSALVTKLIVPIPADASYTKACFHRNDPQRDALYEVNKPGCATLPLPEPPIRVSVAYEVNGVQNTISTDAAVNFATKDGEQQAPLAIAPPISVSMTPPTRSFRLDPEKAQQLDVTLESHTPELGDAKFTAESSHPELVRPQFSFLNTKFDLEGERENETFTVELAAKEQSEALLTAHATVGGKIYSEDFQNIGRPDIGYAFYFRPATERISLVDLKLPPNLKIGYIMGAGDEIPAVLRDLGLDVTLISASSLPTANLNNYGTVVLGIRAYDTQPDVRANNAKLLDYVKQGGTLLVQYNSNISEFNAGHYTPYPLELSRGRVSVEEQPVEILEPASSLLHFPNEITAKDFDGWVQERGLYFASKWSDDFHPVISSHDPGEPPLPGGLLIARYGKGTYIYTGYSFFRELPSGVPGAERLFVNLVSAGHAREP